ncbi:signal peptidase complex subunit 1 [Eublepharis macularius]|uniref:Signal peptidase complex subunit 1 n=1 Tax=Eublepharis macularius TaxID=481883 RepID=A0AA97J965_EUBMA|nr:signal peptidase complex subunit 1 [Eublepharis macularius]
MRRGKETSIPASSVVPALWTRSATKEPEASPDTSPVDSSAADASSQGDPFQAPQPPSKLPSARVGERPLDADLAPALRPEINQHSVRKWVRSLSLEPGKMFNIFRSIPTQMDYKGQKLAEQIFQGIILVSAVIGFIYGYITEQFGWTVYIVMAGFALSCLLTLPPWPIYRRNPLKWLPVQESATDDKKPADRKVKRHPKN